VTDLHSIEIEICTGCNLRCVNCDRSVRQAPSNEFMTVDQIRKFVDESIDCRWKWDHITLLGGEPTLHPELDGVLATLARYHDHDPGTEFRMLSNGYGERVNTTLAALPPWITVVVTHKSPKVVPLFSPFNLAPCDETGGAAEDFSGGCSITELSGLGLSRYGYYACGPGASIDRIFGLDLGIKSLADVTPERVRSQLGALCGRCGHYTHFDRPSLEAKIAQNERRFPSDADEAVRLSLVQEVTSAWTTKEVMSVTWREAYARYRQSPPALSTY
jgi:hypothetical protein